MSIPNEDAMIFQNKGIGFFDSNLSYSEMKITENIGRKDSQRHKVNLRLMEYQSLHNNLHMDKGSIKNYEILLNEDTIDNSQ